MIQAQPTKNELSQIGIPPTAVGGLFRSNLLGGIHGSTQPSFPPYRQTRSFLGQLFHSLAVPGPGSSRRWIWNRERRCGPTESQHSFPSSIARQAPFSDI